MSIASAPAPNLFGLTQYDGLTSFFSDQAFDYGTGTVLPPAAGWIVILLFGFLFALLAVVLVWVDTKFAGVNYNNSEQFNTAGRSIGTGLMAIDLVSHWTWASVLLQCTTYGWIYGAFGTYWFTTNGGMIITLFAAVALELKHRAPKAHTMLEIVHVRWGRAAHFVFFFFAVLTNLLCSLSMLQGCVAAINALTGVNVFAQAFLIPVGVVFYACIGGLKSTFTTSYIHTVIVYVVVLILMIKVFVPGQFLNGIDDVYERLQAMSAAYPVAGQRGGSYLTAWSNPGLQFEVINFCSGLTQMVVDQSYWQTAIAGKASSTAKGFILANVIFMGIVFCLPLAPGLFALAVDLPVNLDEAYAGLVLPASAYVLMGKSGAIMIIVICFMAVTSSGASEMLAVSSLFTFDIYRRYINPKADGKRLVWVSRVGVLAWAIFMGVIMCIAQVCNLNVNWLLLIIGVFAGGAVWPLILLITWDRVTGKAAISGAVIGSVSGITSWLVTAQLTQGSISILNTEANAPLLAGNLISNMLSLILVVSITLIFPEGRFDWEILKEKITSADVEVVKGGHLTAAKEDAADAEEVARVRHKLWIVIAVLFFLGMIVWPVLSLPAGTPWSKSYFRFIVILGFFFIVSSLAIGTFLPLWEARSLYFRVFTGKTFDEWYGTSFRGASSKSIGNGAAKSAKELELEDSAHGASNFDKEKAANGAATH